MHDILLKVHFWVYRCIYTHTHIIKGKRMCKSNTARVFKSPFQNKAVMLL